MFVGGKRIRQTGPVFYNCDMLNELKIEILKTFNAQELFKKTSLNITTNSNLIYIILLHILNKLT